MSLFFFFNDTATTEIYTLSLHDALPICPLKQQQDRAFSLRCPPAVPPQQDHHADGGPLDRFSVFAFSVFAFPIRAQGDRKSTRLNSSHSQISYAVFCLKKKKKKN